MKILSLTLSAVLAKKAVIAQLVEHQFPKLKVAGSIPVYRSGFIIQSSSKNNPFPSEIRKGLTNF